MNVLKYAVLCSVVFTFSISLFPQTKTDGWEEGSSYNKHFKPQKIDTVAGKILKIEKTSPMPGMAEGIQMLIKSGKDTILVQVCPKWMADNLNISLKKDDEVEVEGCKAVCGGVTVFMASRLVGPGIILQLRDEKGSPIWDRLR